MRLLQLTLICILLLMSKVGIGQCDITTEAELSIHSINSKHSLSYKTKRAIRKSIKGKEALNYVVLDFNDFNTNCDSVLICIPSNGIRSCVWKQLNKSAKPNVETLILDEFWTQPFLVVYIDCARVEIPIFSGKDYYKFEQILVTSDGKSTDNVYQLTLNWRTLK